MSFNRKYPCPANSRIHIIKYIVILISLLLYSSGTGTAKAVFSAYPFNRDSYVCRDNFIKDHGGGDTSWQKDKTNRTTVMNYHKWIKILGEVTRLINKVLLDDMLKIELVESGIEKTYSFTKQEPAALKINIIFKDSNKLLATYMIIPWQTFSRNINESGISAPAYFDNLITVTEYAIIYISYSINNLNSAEKRCMESFNMAFKDVVDYDNNQAPLEDDVLNIPENIQIIKCDIFKYYIDLQVAIPGSSMPEYARWATVSEYKMLHLNLVPDIGPVKRMWFKPKNLNISTYYTSVEKDLQDLFTDAVDKSLQNPENRAIIFNKTKDNIRNLFCAANSYVNFLNDEYAARLRRWLLLSAQVTVRSNFENIFPDYEPKRTPDTVLDFMPELAEEIGKIPEARLENLKELIQLLKIHQERAIKNPGQWIEGNILLGANPQEYQPSPDELIAGEIGDRIQVIINSGPREQIKTLLQNDIEKFKTLEYTRFTFIHVDVMGSGRFFYVDTMEKVTLNLE